MTRFIARFAPSMRGTFSERSVVPIEPEASNTIIASLAQDWGSADLSWACAFCDAAASARIAAHSRARSLAQPYRVVARIIETPPISERDTSSASKGFEGGGARSGTCPAHTHVFQARMARQFRRSLSTLRFARATRHAKQTLRVLASPGTASLKGAGCASRATLVDRRFSAACCCIGDGRAAHFLELFFRPANIDGHDPRQHQQL